MQQPVAQWPMISGDAEPVELPAARCPLPCPQSITCASSAALNPKPAARHLWCPRRTARSRCLPDPPRDAPHCSRCAAAPPRGTPPSCSRTTASPRKGRLPRPRGPPPPACSLPPPPWRTADAACRPAAPRPVDHNSLSMHLRLSSRPPSFLLLQRHHSRQPAFNRAVLQPPHQHMRSMT